ncbi:hypothetical protein [Lewinella sp. LCG006]|uniref:hypothetical protein n=1 Tax=Lewinella sp. LCG006 TaxID=3231911 RepID=UPI0034613E02
MLIKFLVILSLFGAIYLWNRFLVKNMIKGLIGFHKTFNAENLNRQPVKFVIENEEGINKAFTGFFWVGAVLISLSIMMG